MKFLGEPRSGSYAGQTSSRNRFGQYVRNRSVPVNPNSVPQGNVRARLSNNAAAWRALTDVQREGWISLGLSITRTDSLGQTYNLTGFQAYCLINNNNLAAGNAITSAAPAIVDPGTLLTATVTLTAAAFSIAYTATPLATGVRLFAFASPQRSAGRYFEGDYRLIAVSTAAQASPLVLTTAYAARLGTPVVGNKVFISLALYQTGFQGPPLLVAQVVA
jgi:hypothetical protein